MSPNLKPLDRELKEAGFWGFLLVEGNQSSLLICIVSEEQLRRGKALPPRFCKKKIPFSVCQICLLSPWSLGLLSLLLHNSSV